MTPFYSKANMLKILPILLLLLLSPGALLAQAPQITQPPVAQTVTEGQTAQFTVAATGSNLVYQWMREGVPLVNGGRISGALAETLAISGTLQSDTGSYSVVVSVSGSPDLKTSSDGVLLKVNPPTPPAPQITHQPTGQTVIEGQSAQFTVVATGSNLLFQWSKDGLALVDGGRINGAGTATLSITGTLEADEGSYSVVVTVSGFPELKASSDGALLKVDPPLPTAPQISQQPVGLIVAKGQNAQFTVLATGTNLIFQWAKDGVALFDGERIAGATTAGLTVTGAQSLDEGSYSVVVSVSGAPELKASSNGALLQVYSITVEQPAGTNLINNSSTVNFGLLTVGTNSSRTFTIKNPGAVNQTLGTITFEGANSSDFAVTAAPTSPLVPAGSTTFNVTFAPGGTGVRNAVLHIPSSDPETSTFSINLTGSATTSTAPRKAQITNPANGSTLTSVTLPLVWDAGVGVTRYDLYVGTTVGGREVYSGNQGTLLSRTVTVPANGAKVYVTLWSLVGAVWDSNTYVFTTQSPARAVLVSPANGSTLTNGTLNLNWTAGAGVSSYTVYVGSTVGGKDIANINAGTATSRSIPVLQDGGPIYVTLWSLIGGAWQSEGYWFNTALPASGSIAARLTSPANTSTLGSTSATFDWDAGTGVTRRDLWIGSSPDGYDLYKGASEPDQTHTLNLPGDGRRIYATLHSLIGAAWTSNAYYFTAITSPPPQAAQLISPANGSTLAGASLALTWNHVGATRYDLYLGSTPMAFDLYKGNEGTNTAKTVTVPTDGRPIYLALWSQLNGAWLQNSYWFTTANTVVGNQKARMTSPANGSVLPGTTANFDWDTGTGVTNYSLYVGTTPNGRELYSATNNTIRSRTLTTLPTDGRKIYVALWSQVGGVWQSNNYLYTAANVVAVKAAMTSPAPGSTFTSATVTFNWSAGTGTQYWMQIGRTPGSSTIYSGDQGTNLTKTLTTMPTDGSPIYVKLQSLINGVWQTNEYIYTAALPP